MRRSKLINGDLKEYDEETCEPIYHMKCPSGLCNHTGIDHRYKKRRFFKRLYAQGDYECIKCGDIELEEWKCRS